MLAAPVATFVILQPAAPRAAGGEISLAAPVSVAREIAAPSATAPPESVGPPMVLSTLVALWLAGVLVLSVRLLGGWMVARRLATTAGRDVDDYVQDLASRVAERLQLNRLVRIAESSTVAVPVVVGWLKPVVLLPAAALSGLAPAHIEALLAHELAHVRRHDYLVNLLQTAVETLLFYHPGVWWLSRRVRIEREHCCDDLAVSVCDRFVYVSALTDLATMTTHARLALAATDGSLLGRVRRLLATDADDRPGAGWLSIVVLAVMAAALTPALLALGGGQQPPSTVPAPSAAPKATTVSPLPQPAVSVPAAAAPAALRRQQPAATGEPQRTDVDAVKQQLVEVEVQLAALRREQREVEAERAREENAIRREAAVARLAALERALAEATTRREIGLTSEAPVEDVRMQVEAARRELRLIEVESRTASAALSLEARREQAEQMYGRLQEQYAAALAESEARRAPQTGASAPPPGVHTVGGDVREPRLLKRVEPLYPPVAKAAKMQGPVYVQAIIARDGQVRDATVVGGAPFPVLREAALAAVRQWVYEPTVINGEPVEVQLSIQVNFRLDGGSSAAPAPPVNAFPVSDATAQVQTGDILLVDIAGEDQIPRWYVLTGGAIRLPLIGSIKVAGLTAGAVRASVSRALAERGLAQGKAVTVTIHRPR
jgi:TonB family protein